MAYPKYSRKHLLEALVNPEHTLKYREINKKNFPNKYILIYQSKILKYFKRKFKGKYKKVNLFSKHYIYTLKNKNIGLFDMGGIGSPHACVFLEILIGLGGKRFISIGDAGGLQTDGYFVCEKALRDEGTSYHYLSHGDFSYPDKHLTRKLENSFRKRDLDYIKAPTWTIDSPYRETRAEIKRYKRQGIATVDMEASALFAVAKFRGVKIASAFIVSDVLDEKEWKPHFRKFSFKKMRKRLLDVAIDCLSN